jgi:hypothetical protein
LKTPTPDGRRGERGYGSGRVDTQRGSGSITDGGANSATGGGGAE